MEDLIDLEGEGNWDPKQSSQRTGKEPMLPERLDGSEWPLGDSVKICSKASATDVQLIGDVFSRSMPPSFSDTPTSGMKSKLLLSEALEGSHWAKKEEGSINKTTTPENDWANFSPVNSSTRHHHHHHLTIDTSNWVQTVTESSGEDPVIITDTSTGADDGLVDASPGWQAFSTGEEEASHTPTDWHELSTNTGRERSLLTTADSDRSVVEPPVFNTVDSTDSLYHSCATIFANSFTRGQQLLTNDNDREQRETCRAEKRENGAGHLSRDCDSDWQWIKDEGFARLLWKWSQTSLHHPPPSSCRTQLSSLLWGNPSINELEGGVTLPLGDDEKFDWTPRGHRRRRSMSPDVVPNLFRPRKESLVDVDFDHDRAASGLAVLSEVELEVMCDEMTSKFSRLSAELLTCLQTRDVLAGELEAKNRFVSALLRVQQLHVSQENNGGGVGETGRGRQWAWTPKKKDEDHSAVGSRYLQTIIPYKIPTGLRWQTETLTQLTKVLKAIAEGSNTVPKLMSEYLQREFITSPVTDRRHSFKDSISPEQTAVLSNLSI